MSVKSSLIHGLKRFFWLTGEGNRFVPTGWLGRLVALLAVIGTAVVIYMALFSSQSELLHVSLFLVFMFPIAFLTTTISKSVERITWFDAVLGALGSILAAGLAYYEPRYHTWMQSFDQLTTYEIWGGLGLVALSLEMVRRATGWPLLLISFAFLAYVVWGDGIAGSFSHGGVDLTYFLEMQAITMDGLIGVPLYVAATYAFLFVLFGAFFQLSGGGQLFFDIAACSTGGMIGGPAKACVVSSALYGSVSGSPTADVATTGPITIPLMERFGISKKQAAATEAAASSGGALLPPVMGAVAFLMADMTGILYRDILIAGLLSACLYYMGVFSLVHFECRRLGIKAMPAEERVTFMVALRRGWPSLIPIFVLTYFLLSGFSPAYVAAGASLVTLVTSWIAIRHAIGPRKLVSGCVETCFRVVPLTAAVAVAGIIIGCIEMTGLSSKAAALLYAMAGGLLVPSLIVSAVVLIILGMGMPTVAVYVMGAALLAPVLIGEFGLPVLGTHMFLLYFSCMSAITPPVAVACFTAASIANANPFSVAPYASKLAVAGYVVPFFFIFNPALLMEGGPLAIIGALMAAAAMVLCFGVAIHGWILTAPLNWFGRLLFAAFGVLLIVPNLTVQAVTFVFAALVWRFYLKRARARESEVRASSISRPGVAGSVGVEATND
ncbi:TRAP transporter fused permease subunit [Marinobacter sp. TBZ242]|uniref:TRAP transporter fused permease subunit n=1 Tax=Marinobacter azerbaijanicus TaxID=3050455 RepID=A0ABT7IGG9_9GAMM|nr:TRAP transporter fused permease subunit [Marinobacter sp. TBZ242]MDL0433268.1 TRAP transporter fused permease subunit [Marinobacter sp. TBZ242]